MVGTFQIERCRRHSLWLNGWMSVVGNAISVPVGSPAQLMALRLAP